METAQGSAGGKVEIDPSLASACGVETVLPRAKARVRFKNGKERV